MRFFSNKRTNALTALVIAGSIIFTSVPVYAENVSDLENKSASIENELASIDSELLSIADKMQEMEAKIAITDSEMQRTEDMLEQSVKDEERQYNAMKSRIKYMYESGSSSMLEMLFSAENISDFVNKADFVQSVSEYDRDMLTELKDIKLDIITHKENITEQKESLDKLRLELNSTKTSLSNRADELSIDLSEYRDKINQLRAEEKRKQEEALQNNIHHSGNNNANSGNNNANSGNTSGNGETHNSSKPTPNVNASELELFAALLQCEALQDYECLLAVATVIMNRVESPRFPNTIRDVIYAPGQFEPTWTGRLDKVLRTGATSLSRKVAQDAINGKRLSSVADCYFFLYAPSTNRKGVVIGDNVFFQSW